MLEKWLDKLKDAALGGMNETVWVFDGVCDLSGSWFWTNKALGLTLAATPFWDGALEAIPVQIYNTSDGGDEYLLVEGTPSSADEYLDLMNDFLNTLDIPEKFKGVKKPNNTIDSQLSQKQAEMKRLSELMDVQRQEIHQLMVEHYTREGVSLPVYVDVAGIVHAPEAFKKEVYEFVDRIMENIMTDENLCRAREALEYFYMEHGVPRKKEW